MNTIDQSVHVFFQSVQAPWLTYVFYVFTWFFNTVPAIILITLTTFVLGKWGGKKHAIEFVCAMGLSIVLVWFMKVSFDYPRPEFGIITAYGPGFPSAHTAIATTFFLFFTQFISRDRNVSRRIIHWLFCILVPLMVALSRLYLGVHWFSDVWVGVIVGGVALLGVRKSYVYLMR